MLPTVSTILLIVSVTTLAANGAYGDSRSSTQSAMFTLRDYSRLRRYSDAVLVPHDDVMTSRRRHTTSDTHCAMKCGQQDGCRYFVMDNDVGCTLIGTSPLEGQSVATPDLRGRRVYARFTAGGEDK